MQVAVLEFIEHRFDGVVVMSKRLADTSGQARVLDQLAQACARERHMT